MNLELLESFGQNFPEDFDGPLDCVSIAVTCSFNRQGTLLAVGCNDGRIVIWDFLTRGIAKFINAHVHPVCSLSWNRNGHKLLSAATDNTVSIWDVLSSENTKVFRFPSPVLKIQWHPRNSNQFLVCPLKHAAVLMTVKGEHKMVPLDDDSDLNIVASFDRRGRYIYTGNAKGRILAFNANTLEMVASFRVTTGGMNTTAIKSLEFARRGECFLVNSADRIIRVYESREVLTCGKDGEPEPMQKLQDLVNKTLWKRCCFSGDGEYIVAGSARQHALYIWEKAVGTLVKILHGTKGELLLDVVWHPVRPIIVSISSGLVSIWAQNQVENWSAFAPDFKELDENVEYEERESEFDLEDEDKEKEESKEQVEEDVEVDVDTIEPIQAFVSSDEEEEDANALLFLPVSPEVEDPEDSMQTDNKKPSQVAMSRVTKIKAVKNYKKDGDTPEKKKGDDSGPTPLDTPTSKRTRHTNNSDTTSERRRSSQTGSASPSSAKKKKTKTVDVDLPGAPKDEIHPLLNVKKQPEKGNSKKIRPQKSKSSKPDKSRHKDRSSRDSGSHVKDGSGRD